MLTLDGTVLEGKNELNGVNDITVKWINKVVMDTPDPFPIGELFEKFSIKEDSGWKKEDNEFYKTTRYKRD